jgi:hypothetical protein
MTRTILNKLIAAHNLLPIPASTEGMDYAVYTASLHRLADYRAALRKATLEKRRAKYTASLAGKGA